MRALQHFQQTSTAAVTHSNTAAAQPIVPTFTIPASELQVGRRVRLRAWGVYSTAASGPTINFALQSSGASRNTHTAYTLPGSADNWAWEFEGEVITDTNASGGTMFTRAQVRIQNASTGETITLQMPRATSITHNGVATTFGAVMTFGTANAANTLTVQASEVVAY